MLKFIIGLLVLLAICTAAGVIRKMRGGRLLPAPENIDGINEPQSLRTGTAPPAREAGPEALTHAETYVVHRECYSRPHCITV